jgi:hypothetical protein
MECMVKDVNDELSAYINLLNRLYKASGPPRMEMNTRR